MCSGPLITCTCWAWKMSLWIHFLPLFHDQRDHSPNSTVGWVVDFLLALMCGGKLILLSSLDSQAVCPHSLVQEPIEGQGNKPSPTYNMQNICWSALQCGTCLCCMELSYPQNPKPLFSLLSLLLLFCSFFFFSSTIFLSSIVVVAFPSSFFSLLFLLLLLLLFFLFFCLCYRFFFFHFCCNFSFFFFLSLFVSLFFSIVTNFHHFFLFLFSFLMCKILSSLYNN